MIDVHEEVLTTATGDRFAIVRVNGDVGCEHGFAVDAIQSVATLWEPSDDVTLGGTPDEIEQHRNLIVFNAQDCFDNGDREFVDITGANGINNNIDTWKPISNISMTALDDVEKGICTAKRRGNVGLGVQVVGGAMKELPSRPGTFPTWTVGGVCNGSRADVERQGTHSPLTGSIRDSTAMRPSRGRARLYGAMSPRRWTRRQVVDSAQA